MYDSYLRSTCGDIMLAIIVRYYGLMVLVVALVLNSRWLFSVWSTKIKIHFPLQLFDNEELVVTLWVIYD